MDWLESLADIGRGVLSVLATAGRWLLGFPIVLAGIAGFVLVWLLTKNGWTAGAGAVFFAMAADRIRDAFRRAFR